MIQPTNRGRWRRVLAGALAASLLGGAITPAAFAGDGGAGSGSGGGTDTSIGGLEWAYKDDSSGSFGPATDFNSVLAAYRQMQLGITDAGAARARAALNAARTECETQFNNRHPGEGAADCRVVGVGVSYNASIMGDDATGWSHKSGWLAKWNERVANKTYSHGNEAYRVTDPFSDNPNRSVQSLMDREASKPQTGVIVIVLNKYEPKGPQDYPLNIATRASATTTTAGATNQVSDVITMSRGDSPIAENVSGTIYLHWRGVDGTTREASKRFTGPNQGDTTVSFSHTDIDPSWKCWPAGKFWFDVQVPKQGKMKADASHLGENDAKESWSATIPDPVKEIYNQTGDKISNPNQYLPSGSLYEARITAQSSGSKKFWLYDTIRLGADKVNIGAVDKDDLSKVHVLGPDGQKADADISVDDTVAGQRTVKAYVKNPVSGQYTLVVPQATRPSDGDYTIKDDSQGCWNGDGQMCQTGGSREVTKVTPTPDKSWVLDEEGALNTADPEWTNQTGADTKTFVPGDAVGAVVNGKIPAHLFNLFTSYQIVDDWSDSAQYIDWNQPGDVKVYVNGEDKTGEFDITVDLDKKRTVASAKASFLRSTAFQNKDLPVKLYVAGTFKANPEAGFNASMLNKGYEIWNNEQKPTNEPPVFVRTPHPDKAWSADEGTATHTEDPEWTNKVSADTKTFIQEDTFSVTVNGLLPKNLARDLSAYVIGDDWGKAAKYLDMGALGVKVYVDGVDKTGEFDIKTEGSKTSATAKASLLKGTAGQAKDRAVRMVVNGQFKADVLEAGQSVTVPNNGWERWNNQPIQSNEPPVREWAPNPDKSWVTLGEDGEWNAVIDPKETNKTGGDNLVYLDGDKLASVVNGTISAGLAKVPSSLVLTDDYANADYIWDTDNPMTFKVYDMDVDTDKESSFTDIARKGRDVTGMFTIEQDGTVITATAKQEYLDQLKDMGKARQVSLLIPGVVNYANGGGAAQVRDDFGKDASAEVEFCVNPDNTPLTNKGSQQIANTSEPTNEPKVCGYVPPVEKDVVSEASQGGEQESVDGKTVFPGQKVEYQLTTHPRLAENLAYDVVDVTVTDTYDPYLVPDKQTVEVTDLHTGKSVSKKQYTTVWNEAEHTFTLKFSDEYVAKNWPKGSDPSILIRFEGTVSKDAPTDRLVENQWMLTLNNSLTPSNVVKNPPPQTEPDKELTKEDPSVIIDGMTALLGDKLYYRVTLDAQKLADPGTAYNVYRLGLVDDWDDEYLSLHEDEVQILDSDGQDVTDKFNIQHKNGVTYAFAKLVDTLIPATGETVPGDPQPEDLEEYSGRKHDPLADPSIDQSLLGKKYTLVLPVTVTKVTDGYTVVNTATQITNDLRVDTPQVTTPLKPINPSKDVVVNIGDESANGTTIPLGSTFLYQLDSSVLPANRAYPEVTEWSITDPIDTTHDRFTGQWAVYAVRDVVDGDTMIAKTGDRIAGTGVDGEPFGGDLFTMAEGDDGALTFTATDRWLALASAMDEVGFRVYVQCERIAPGDPVVNTFTETFNGKDMPSNTVETRTPEQVPSIDVEKYDIESGETEGDRDETDQALNMASDSVQIGIKITNTSPADANGEGMSLTNLKVTDELVAGSGTLTAIEYPDGWDTLVLKPGDTVTLKATLAGVKEGDTHTNRVGVTADSLTACPVVDEDPFDDEPGKPVGGTHGENNDLCTGDTVADQDLWNGYRETAPLNMVGLVTGTVRNHGATVAAFMMLAASMAALATVISRKRA